MNRKQIPGWLVVPGLIGVAAVLFFIGYWPDGSPLDGVLGVLAAICWFLIELVFHSFEGRSEEERNNFGLL